MAKLSKRITSLLTSAALIACGIPAFSANVNAEVGALCTTADDWTALFDRRGQSNTWLGADGIYSVAIDGNDAYGSANESTKTFFIFSDSLMGTADENGHVTWAPGQPSQTSAVLTGNTADPDNIRFVWGNGGNGEFGWETHLFGEHKWMLDCFVVDDAIYILGFPERNWKPAQMDMIKIPIKNGEPDYANYSKTSDITQLNHYDAAGTYLYSYGIGIMKNTESAGAPNPDGYIYFYGYRDALQEYSRKDLIVSRLKESDFPDFSNLTYWNGTSWSDNIEESAPLVQNISCEMSVTPITSGPSAGKYLAVYTEGTESAKMNYAVGDSPVGPFDTPVTFYLAPEHGLDNGGRYTYNAKAHPHLSSDGKLLVSYNTNNSNTFGNQSSFEYRPVFLWLNLDMIGYTAERTENLALNGTATADSVNATFGGEASLVNDGDFSTRWQSNAKGSSADSPAWLQIELDKAYPLTAIDFYWEAARPSQAGMKLEISEDGNTWTVPEYIINGREESTYEGNTLYKDAIDLIGKPTAKFIRVTITAMDAGKESPSCWEFEVYGESDGSVTPPEPIMKGDVNGDGTINSTDFMQVRRHFLGLYNIPADKQSVADVNGDGNINSTDFMQIRRHFLGLYTIG